MIKRLLPLSLVCSSFFFTAGSLKAQLIINDSLDFAQISTLLQGFGTNISNTVYNCDSAGVAQFSGVSELPNLNGMLLTTGFANDVAGPSSNFASGTMLNGNYNDIDLMSISGGSATYDGCILEFDCVPLGDTLLFNYTFASEEYPEFVGSSFNDAFGIFLTGPGYANANIANIPGSSTPVTVNNVNASINSSFYQDNSAGQFCAFDGFTISLTSTTAVTPNQTYHFKIGVADVGDAAFDTGVFLEAFSFRSNLSTGQSEHSSPVCTVFANSLTADLTVRFREPSAEHLLLEVLDLNGKKVYTGTLNSGSLSHAVSTGLTANGIYFVRILKGNETVLSEKFILNK